MAEPELSVINRAKRGDSKAFSMIVDTYETTVFNVAYRIVGDRDDAADIAQSVFVKVYDNLHAFDPAYKLFSWLYRITLNEALNFNRKQQRTVPLKADLAAASSGPEEDYRQVEMSEHLQRALLKMSLDHRIVIVLKHLLQLSYREISDLLDLPEKTVKSRLYSARQVLRKQLMKQGYA
jgi:RNA polymerase sigma-70 factor (ECF subfamily)